MISYLVTRWPPPPCRTYNAKMIMNPPTPIASGKLYRILVANGDVLATALKAPIGINDSLT